MNRKAQADFGLGRLATVVIVLLVVGLISVVGLTLLDDQKDEIGPDACSGRSDTFTSYNDTSNLCYNSSGSTTQPSTVEWNASADTVEGIAKVPSKLPLIAGAVVLVLLIVIIVAAFRNVRT